MTKQVKKKNNDKKKYSKSDYVLLSLFIFLLVLCVALAIGAIATKYNYDKNKSLMLIPVTKDNLKTSLEITTKNKKKDDIIKYKFRVNNYYNSIDNGKAKINDTNINYSIFINNDIDANFKLMKDGKEVKLSNFKTKNFKLDKDKKDEDNYELIIAIKKDVTDDQFVNLIVEGK